MSEWTNVLIMEYTTRKRKCGVCGMDIEPKREVVKLYHKSFHPRCLFKQLVVVVGRYKYNTLLNEYIADKV